MKEAERNHHDFIDLDILFNKFDGIPIAKMDTRPLLEKIFNVEMNTESQTDGDEATDLVVSQYRKG